MNRRVVITGAGVLSSLGFGVEAFWNSVKEGRSGIKNIENIDVSDISTKVGAEIRDFEPSDFIDISAVASLR